MDGEETGEPLAIDPSRECYPFCLVWTSIPLLTWTFPLVGHVGIGDSRGRIHDFSGPYFVSVDDFAFGRPFKYRRLVDVQSVLQQPGKAEEWDSAIRTARNDYLKQNYSLLLNNCHSYVARCLNCVHYRGRHDWTMFSVWALTLTDMTYVSRAKAVRTYCWLPFMGIVALIFVAIFGSLLR